ncbi:MAG: hypothetical protein JKY00_10495 [Roseicyclus sp.]|nr:hypothetical protein [Roseicyclus sp.]
MKPGVECFDFGQFAGRRRQEGIEGLRLFGAFTCLSRSLGGGEGGTNFEEFLPDKSGNAMSCMKTLRLRRR